MTHQRLRHTLVAAGVTVAGCSAAALALASRRIVAEQAAYRAPAAHSCTASAFNRSALLPGTSVSVAPLPGSADAPPRTQISFLGAPRGALGSLAVRGSKSGDHAGRLLGYSQGDGASFLPSQPFRSGERVYVRGKVKTASGTRRFSFDFAVAAPDALSYKPTPTNTHRDPNEKQHFTTRPDLQPPALAVGARSTQTAPGYILAAPYNGPGASGPMIFDEAGQLVWFDPLRSASEAANLQVQQYNGKPVLTWWQGYILQQGFGQGEVVLADSSYRQIGRVHAGNGYKADLHDFHLLGNGAALLTAYDPIHCNLAAVGGPRGAAVTDSIFQEIDLRTGLVRREWHSLDHVPLADSYSSALGASTEWPYDYFHLNSIDQHADGTTLISARNTWALYELSTSTGKVLARIGGRRTTLKLAAGAATAFQHDASARPDGTIAVFDNGAVPKVHSQSRAIVLSIDSRGRTERLLSQYEHTPPLSSGSQGNVQTLGNGDVFIGWGASPYFSEFSAGGALLFDAHMHGSYQSYRAYRQQWTGTPSHAPTIAARAAGPGAPVTVYASWNGDTRTASWEVLAGPAPNQLAPVASAGRSGFETAILAPGPEPYVAVQALDPSGAVLGVSATITG